jgi:hypothetical protein
VWHSEKAPNRNECPALTQWNIPISVNEMMMAPRVDVNKKEAENPQMEPSNKRGLH